MTYRIDKERRKHIDIKDMDRRVHTGARYSKRISTTKRYHAAECSLKMSSMKVNGNFDQSTLHEVYLADLSPAFYLVLIALSKI